MCHPYLTQLVSEHGWTQTSLIELQDFTKTNATLWTMIRDFLEKSLGPTFANLGSLGRGL